MTRLSILLLSSTFMLAACSGADTDYSADAAAEAEPETVETVSTEMPAEESASEMAAMDEMSMPELSIPSGAYMNDPNHTTMEVSLMHLGLAPYSAFLATADAQLLLDVEDPSSSTINVTIDPNSVFTSYRSDYQTTHPDSSYDSWESAIAGQFLGAGESDMISFVTTSFDYDGGMTGTLMGDLTMNGTTAPITLDVEMTGQTASHPFTNEPALGLTASGTILRSDFGIAPNMDSALSDEVTFEFSADFLRNSQNDEPME